MLTSEATGLVLKAARGAIKLSRRIDLVRAEQEAVGEPLALPVPPVGLAPTQPQMRSALRRLLQETEREDPDPIADDREAIVEVVEVNPDNALLFEFMQKCLPEQALARVLDMNGELMKKLRELRPDWAGDPDLVVSCCYVGSGRDERRNSYAWRLGLTVVDTVADLGADNVALFVRDPGLQSMAAGILKRFGDANVDRVDSAGAVVRAALGATLNGALAAGAAPGVDVPVIDALLDALVTVRSSLPEAERDRFVIGLLEGRGYLLLVSSLLEKASGLLGVEETVNFKTVAATLLQDVAGIVRQQPSFERFFQDHWGDLLRAGFASIEQHGPVLLRGASPLLKDVLTGVAANLARSPNNKLISPDILVSIVDTAVAAAAAHPEQVDRIVGPDWLGALVSSVSTTLAHNGIRAAFTRQGVDRLIRDTLGTFAANPDLVIENPGLARDLLRGVLTSLSTVDTFAAEALASAAVGSALQVMAGHPEVLRFKYAEQVASLAGKIGALVEERQLTGVQGADLLSSLTAVLAENPALFLELEKNLTAFVVDAVLSAHRKSGGLLSGARLIETIEAVVRALAATGKAALKNHPAAELVTRLEAVILAGLDRAEKEIGNRISQGDLPEVVGRLVRAWARGEIGAVDPDNDNFRRLFAGLIDQHAAS